MKSSAADDSDKKLGALVYQSSCTARIRADAAVLSQILPVERESNAESANNAVGVAKYKCTLPEKENKKCHLSSSALGTLPQS